MTTTVFTTASASAASAAVAGRTEEIGQTRARRRRKRNARRNLKNYQLLDFLREKYLGTPAGGSSTSDINIPSQISRYTVPDIKESKIQMFPILQPNMTILKYDKPSPEPTNKPPDQLESPLFIFR
jgi:hypothetical protein